MGLNPSCNSVKGNRLPVLGDPPFRRELAETAKQELLRATDGDESALRFEEGEVDARRVYKAGTKGDMMDRMGILAPYEGMENDVETIEVVRVVARAYGWRFSRAWYYWICVSEGAPLPMTIAQEVNKQWGEQIRVDGYAGRDEVAKPMQGYHVDTFDGLKKLMQVLKSINQERADDHRTDGAAAGG